MVKPLKTQDRVLEQFSPDEQYLLRTVKSTVKGMEAVIKFHRNRQGSGKNPFISWTLNKIAVIDSAYLKSNPDMPVKDMDWWRVKIEHETSPGQPIGCFAVRPLWPVQRSDLAILAPSTWTQVQTGLTVMLYPKIQPWMPWIIPKALRKLIMRKAGGAALVIPLSYPPEGTPDTALKCDQPLFPYKNEPDDMLLDEFMIDVTRLNDTQTKEIPKNEVILNEDKGNR